MPAPLRLYVETLWISPYVYSSFVALTEKGLNFEIVGVPLIDGGHLTPDYETRSLTARVPCLEHGAFALSESSAIAEDLDERFPAPAHRQLLPEGLEARGRCRQLMAWLRSDLGALREERSTVTMFYRLHVPPLTKAGKRDASKLLRVAEAIIPPSTGPLFGDWCLLDSELSFMLHRLLLNRDPVPDHVRSYAEREWQRPSVQAYVSHARPAEVPERYWSYSGTSRLEPMRF